MILATLQERRVRVDLGGKSQKKRSRWVSVAGRSKRQTEIAEESTR